MIPFRVPTRQYFLSDIFYYQINPLVEKVTRTQKEKHIMVKQFSFRIESKTPLIMVKKKLSCIILLQRQIYF